MKTKSYLFTAASAAILLASCSESEVVEMPASRAIGFSTYVGNTTRAVAPETTINFLQNDGNGFYVFGQYKEGSETRHVFDGKSDGSHVTWKTNSWGYSPINYWLDGKTYKFAAYGPAKALNNGNASFDYDSNALKIENFKVDGQTDLVAAEYASDGKTPSADNSTESAVPFKFYHMLSKVKFTLVNGWRNDVTLNLAALTLNGVKAQGTLTTQGTMGNAGFSAPGNDIWNNIATNATTYKDTEYTDIQSNPWSNAVFGSKYEFELYLLPQSLENNDDLKLSFAVSVINKSGNGPDLGNGAGKSVIKTISIPAETVKTWEPSKAYNYTLTIDGEIFDLKPIVFDNITVDEWETATEEEVNKEDVAR